MSRFNEKRFSTPPSFSSAAREKERERVPSFASHTSLILSLLFPLSLLSSSHFSFSPSSHDQLVGVLVTVLSCFRRTPFLGHSSSVIYNLLQPLIHWRRFTTPSWNKSTISKKCLEGNSLIRNHSNVSSFFRAIILFLSLLFILFHSILFLPQFKVCFLTTILHCINRVLMTKVVIKRFFQVKSSNLRTMFIF